MRFLIVFGTRPEAIKMAPLIKAFQDTGLNIQVCITAQHREMLDQVLEFFEIVPDYDLNLMQPGQSLNQLSSRILAYFDKVLSEANPDWVLVHGDTTTSAMCALAAFHRGIKVAHVEAGLRTYNKHSPFPEEINRQLTGRIADLHFSPTAWAADNLWKEGINKDTVVITGNTVIDAFHLGLKKIEGGYHNSNITMLKELIEPDKKVVLVTGHRRENFGEKFENICLALREIAKNPDVQIIYPVHLNPNVQEPVNRILAKIENIHLIEPLDYPSFIYAMSKSYLIITDSGGVQEEAPSLGKPVLVMRDTTERPEAVAAGTVRLVGTDFDTIYQSSIELLSDKLSYEKMSKAHNPYGDGMASEKIIKALA